MPDQTLGQRLALLHQIGLKIKEGKKLSDYERLFISAGLIDIAKGINAEIALDIETSKPGHRKQSALHVHQKRALACSYIESVMRPVEDFGKGYNLKDAIEEAARSFGYTPGSMKQIWLKRDKKYPSIYRVGR